MATLRAALKALLENDSALAALLTGGVFDAEDEERAGGGARFAPHAADGVVVKPYAMIRWRDSNAYQTESANALGAEREMVEIYNYQDSGLATIEAAMSQEKKLLHDQYLTADDRAIAHFIYAFGSGEVPAAEVGKAPCRFVRFQIIHIRN